MNVSVLATAVLPVVGLITLGAFLRRWTRIDQRFWPSAEALAYFILFPSLWVDSLSNAPDITTGDLRALLAAVCTVCLGAATIWLARPFLRIPHATFTSVFQGGLRFNTYIGLSVAAALFDADGFKVAVIVAATLSVVLNVMSTMIMRAGGSVMGAFADVLRNPLIVSCLIGVGLNLLDWRLPGPVGGMVSALSAASLPIGLMVVGAALDIRASAQQPRLVAGTTVFKLLLLPLIAWCCGVFLGLPDRDLAVLILFAALPTAPTAYALARELGGDAPLMARLISVETIASAFTLLGWLFWIQAGALALPAT